MSTTRISRTIGAAVVTGVAIAATTLGVVPGVAHGEPPGSPIATYAQLERLPLTVIARRFTPLDRVARAIDEVGRGVGKPYYSNVKVDGVHQTVTLFITEPQWASWFIRQARTVDPGASFRLLRLDRGYYPKAALDAAADRLVRSHLPFRWSTIAVSPVGAGLEMTVPDPNQARMEAAQPSAMLGGKSVQTVADVPISYSHGDPQVPLSRETDTYPFIGGDDIVDTGWNGGGAACTAGIPVARNSDNAHFMVTANHCFPGGTVYTGGQYPNVLGPVQAHSGVWDAELIKAGVSGEAWIDGVHHPALSGSAYSYNGDLVAQDGFTSYQATGSSVKVITVNNQDFRYQLKYSDGSVHEVRGVQGATHVLVTAVRDGDSGGLVYRPNDNGTSQVRGIVSAGEKTNNSVIDWTEATDIFNQFGLRIAPNI